MKILLAMLAAALMLSSCRKNSNDKVEIFLLTSFQTRVDTSTYPGTVSIQNPVLAGSPLVANSDIAFYSPSSHTFTLQRDVPAIKSLTPANAFAVCVNGAPLYYGQVRPGYLSSIVFYMPSLDPIFYLERKLQINFVTFTPTPPGMPADPRNDEVLIRALGNTGRLK